VKTVFADTSGFYAAMDNADPFHGEAVRLFRAAVVESWHLATTNYVAHESWALIQRRLGMDAVRDFQRGLLSLCDLVFVDAAWHQAAVQRCLTASRRNLSLTDCVSLEWMQQHQITEAIARDVHFDEAGISVPR
jgi:predicted nucleic acid-binding protein